jgi:hypothetical protein
MSVENKNASLSVRMQYFLRKKTMKNLPLLFLVVICFFAARQSQAQEGNITIKAHIDGESRLILQGNTAQWFQLESAAPGRHQDRNLPTIINDVEWFPIWPDVPDAENRGCECFSDTFEGVDPALPRKSANYELEEVQARRPVTIFQFPEAENDYTLIVDFFDAVGDSDDYEVILKFDSQFEINAGLNDAWYNPETDGQGFFITVFPDLGAVSLAWFTYDTELPAEDATANLGDPGHRWLTAVGPITGNQAIMEIEMTSGGLFDTSTLIDRTDPPGSDGSIILTFTSCNSATIDYDIPSINRQGTVPIRRVADDNIVICEALNSN